MSIKEKLEEQAKAEYGMELAKLNEEERKLAALERRRDDYQNQLFELVSDRLELIKIRRLEDSVENIKKDINIQLIIVRKQEDRVAWAREKLDNAMKERKIYEKLKEKAFEDFKAEINAQEQKEIDELVSFRFGSASTAVNE